MLSLWLEQSAARFPDAPALIAGRTTETYARLRDKVVSVTGELTARGLSAGAVFAVAERSPLALAMTSWGVAFCGALLPLNPAWPQARLDAMRRLAGSGILIDDDLIRESWSAAGEVGRPSGRHVGQRPQGASPPRAAAKLLARARKADPHATALIIPTSGSSGEPKGVMLSHANLAASVKAARSRIPLEPGDVWQICLPLYHIGGQAILYRCAEAGACVLLGQEKFHAENALADMHQYAVTHVSLVPAMLANLLEAGAPPSSLKFVLVGGGALSASLAKRAAQAGWPLCPSYGMSEMASQVATLNPLPDDWQPGLVGLPLPGVEVKISAGRIYLRGEMRMEGYLGQGLREGWLETGDLGRLDEQGRLWVQGRADDMLVSGGVNIHPLEVENLLASCPGLSDAAVTALPDEVWGERLIALVVGADAIQTQAWCDRALPSHLRPRRIFSVSSLPRNALGKLERKLVRDMAHACTGIS
jgi:O-succinylbenzoic acid--CoA ligase